MMYQGDNDTDKFITRTLVRAEGTARQKSSSLPTATSELQLFEPHAVAVNHADEAGAISSPPARRGDQLYRPRLLSPARGGSCQLHHHWWQGAARSASRLTPGDSNPP